MQIAVDNGFMPSGSADQAAPTIPAGSVRNDVAAALGLEAFIKTWLGDFIWALPAVGIIGTWLATGWCTLLPLTGIRKIDASIYEAAMIDGANRV